MLVPPLFFFFQAEDGIRDPLVTGVQTCALPILTTSLDDMIDRAPDGEIEVAGGVFKHAYDANWKLYFRSEERRVGKECRFRWSPEDQKKEAYGRPVAETVTLPFAERARDGTGRT